VQAFDSKLLGERLEELTEVFQAKPVSAKGLTVWFNVLREFPTEKVCGVLIAWPRTHTKFPAPAEVWKVVNEISIGERERKAEIERKAQPFEHVGVGGAKAEEFIAQMRKMLNKPAWTPREHWEKTLERSKPGSIGHEYATAALMKMGAITKKEREPGEDDEQKAVNF
jgi:hypothetical protein